MPSKKLKIHFVYGARCTFSLTLELFMDLCLTHACKKLKIYKTSYIIYCKQTRGVTQSSLFILGRSKLKPFKICGFLWKSQDSTTFLGSLFVFN